MNESEWGCLIYFEYLWVCQVVSPILLLKHEKSGLYKWIDGLVAGVQFCILSLLPRKPHLLTHPSKQALTRYTLITFHHLRSGTHTICICDNCIEFYGDSFFNDFDKPFLKQKVCQWWSIGNPYKDGWSKSCCRSCGLALPTSVVRHQCPTPRADGSCFCALGDDSTCWSN